MKTENLRGFLASWTRDNKGKVREAYSKDHIFLMVEFEDFELAMGYYESQPDNSLILIQVNTVPEGKMRYVGAEYEHKIIEALEGAEPDINNVIDRLNNV